MFFMYNLYSENSGRVMFLTYIWRCLSNLSKVLSTAMSQKTLKRSGKTSARTAKTRILENLHLVKFEERSCYFQRRLFKDGLMRTLPVFSDQGLQVNGKNLGWRTIYTLMFTVPIIVKNWPTFGFWISPFHLLETLEPLSFSPPVPMSSIQFT